MAIFGAVLSLAVIAGLSRAPAPQLRANGMPLLPRAGFLHALFAAQQNLVADYFWILTINKVGAAERVQDFRDIYAYADLVTDLDPKFAKVYSFAGVAIPVQVEREKYANADESTALLQKGYAHVPNDYRTAFQLAYNLVFFHHRYKEAADHLTQLQKHPAAPPWLAKFATRLYAQAGDFDMSRALTEEMLEQAEDPESRAAYELRLKEIAQEQLLRELDAAAAAYTSRTGAAPGTVAALVASGDLKELPKDPLEGELFFGKDGRARSTASKFRLEVIYDDYDNPNRSASPP